MAASKTLELKEAAKFERGIAWHDHLRDESMN